MIDGLIQGADGLVTLATEGPRQAVRIFRSLPPDDRAALLKRVGLGATEDTMSYYYGNPQLFKMPAVFRKPGPPLTPQRELRDLGAFKEDALSKALPVIAIGIAGVVLYNMFLKK